MELIDIAEGFLAHLSSEGAILSATIPSYINGEQVEVLVQARQLDDGNPSNDVRVTVRNADGIELGSQHTQVQLLGNAEEIRRALLASVPKEISWAQHCLFLPDSSSWDYIVVFLRLPIRFFRSCFDQS